MSEEPQAEDRVLTTASSAEETADEYSIDELAAHSGVPSRTIRFYQSKGALPKPEIRGRKAVYSSAHVARLELIGTLQERGLRIRAIRDLVAQIDSGKLALQEWLGLQDTLHRTWIDDAPKLYSRDDLCELAGPNRKHATADLVRLGLLKEQGDLLLAESPALLHATLRMEQAGVDLEVTKAATDMARKKLARIASGLVQIYVKRAGDGFGRSASAADMTEAFDAVPDRTRELVNIVFGQELERTLRELVSSGRMAKLTARKPG